MIMPIYVPQLSRCLGSSSQCQRSSLDVKRARAYATLRRTRPAALSHSTNAANLGKTEVQATRDFRKHLMTQDTSAAQEVAIILLQQAALSKDVPPYLTLGAALCIEQQADVMSGSVALLQ